MEGADRKEIRSNRTVDNCSKRGRAGWDSVLNSEDPIRLSFSRRHVTKGGVGSIDPVGDRHGSTQDVNSVVTAGRQLPTQVENTILFSPDA
jgi:hypothetical protein